MKTRLLSVLAVFAMTMTASAAAVLSTTWYVSPTAPAVGDGTEDAPTSLTNAIGRAGYGDTVQLAGGEYQLTSIAGLVVTNGVSLKGNAEDPSSVIIRGIATNVTTRVLSLNDAKVEGITFSGGYESKVNLSNSTPDSTFVPIALWATNALVSDCIFDGATFKQTGRAVVLDGDVVVERTIFRNITGTNGRWDKAPNVFQLRNSSLDYCVISNVYSSTRSSAPIRLYDNVVIRHSTIRDVGTVYTQDRSKGGAFHVASNGCLIEDSIIEGCYCDDGNNGGGHGAAGAIFISGGNFTLRRSKLVNNSSLLGAGAIYLQSGAKVFIEESLIAGNYAINGTSGAIYGVGNESVITIRGSTITDNYVDGSTSSLGAYGLYLKDKAQAIINSTIISGNGPDTTMYLSDNVSIAGAQNTPITNSCFSSEAEIEAKWPEKYVGCVFGNPLFNAENDGAYYLSVFSPGFNKGTVFEDVLYDIEGNARINGGTPDMGAYEFDVDKGYAGITSSHSSLPPSGGEVEFSSLVFPQTGVKSYTWIVEKVGGSKSEVSGSTEYRYTFTDFGAYNISLDVEWADGKSISSPIVSVEVLPPKVFVSNVGANIFPYDTEANAARNIQDAIDAVYSTGDAIGEVVIAPGHYNYEAGRVDADYLLSVEKPLYLYGSGKSKDDVVIDAERKYRILYISELAEGTIVSNITLRGATSKGDQNITRGYCAELRTGLMTDCVVTNAYIGVMGLEHLVYIKNASLVRSIVGCCETLNSGWNRSYGNPIRVDSGRVIDCEVFKNNFSSSYGAALYLNGASAYAQGCVIRDNTLNYNQVAGPFTAGIAVANGATARDCVVYNNQAQRSHTGPTSGGVVVIGAGSLLERCTVTNNLNSASSNSSNKIYAGGGLVGNDAVIKDSLVVGNILKDASRDAAHAGGITCYGTGGKIISSTVSRNENRAVPKKSGVYLGSNAMTNCIAWGNGYTVSGEWVSGNITNATGSVGYTCSLPLEPGEGNTDGDPRFIAPEESNYRLGPYSAARNKGNSEGFVRKVDKDLDGKTRVVGRDIDMGCYEWQTSPTLMRLE